MSVLAVPSSSQLVKLETTGNFTKRWERIQNIDKACCLGSILQSTKITSTIKIFCIWNIQLAKNYGCFCFVIIKISVRKLFYLILILNLDWYAARLNFVQIIANVTIWNRRTLKSTEVDLSGSQSENEMGDSMLARRSRQP